MPNFLPNATALIVYGFALSANANLVLLFIYTVGSTKFKIFFYFSLKGGHFIGSRLVIIILIFYCHDAVTYFSIF